jgi:hypothetical protein
LPACQKKSKRYQTHVEVIQIRQFGQTNRLTDMEIKYVDCPGNVRKVMRIDKDFAACGAKLKVGDRLDAEVEFAYNRERDQYTSSIVRLADCPVNTDPKDEANYEQVENCTELKATGAVVGVRCERQRSAELQKACPWTYRK